jgi:hypothetical protein
VVSPFPLLSDEGRTDDPAGWRVIKVGDRFLEVTPSLSVGAFRAQRPDAWWSCLAVLGGSLLALAGLVGAGLGSVAAIGGVVLFLATAVAAGAERYAIATATGVAAVVWTSAGVSVDLGVDHSLFVSFLALASVGAAASIVGGLGALRRRSWNPPRSQSAL